MYSLQSDGRSLFRCCQYSIILKKEISLKHEGKRFSTLCKSWDVGESVLLFKLIFCNSPCNQIYWKVSKFPMKYNNTIFKILSLSIFPFSPVDCFLQDLSCKECRGAKLINIEYWKSKLIIDREKFKLSTEQILALGIKNSGGIHFLKYCAIASSHSTKLHSKLWNTIIYPSFQLWFQGIELLITSRGVGRKCCKLKHLVWVMKLLIFKISHGSWNNTKRFPYSLD